MANRVFISTIAVLFAFICPRIDAFSQDEISGRAIACLLYTSDAADE